MGGLLEPLYRGISWVLLRWHTLWDAALPDRRFLDTDWDWVLAIACLAVTMRVLLFPLFLVSMRSQSRLRGLQPKVAHLQAVHRDDHDTLRREVIRLYAQERVNPLLGCLPWVVQVPVFLALNHVLLSRDPTGFEPFTGIPKTLYGWTVAQFDSSAAARVLGAPLPGTVTTAGLTTAARIVAGVLALLVVLLVFLFARQVAAAAFAQPGDGKILLWVLPGLVLISSWQFPVGVSLYWIVQNLIVLAQRRWARGWYARIATIPA